MARVLHLVLLAAAASSAFAQLSVKVCKDVNCGGDCGVDLGTYKTGDTCQKMEGKDYHYKATCKDTTWTLKKYTDATCDTSADVYESNTDGCHSESTYLKWSKTDNKVVVYGSDKCDSQSGEITLTKDACTKAEYPFNNYKASLANEKLTIESFELVDGTCGGAQLFSVELEDGACKRVESSLKGTCATTASSSTETTSTETTSTETTSTETTSTDTTNTTNNGSSDEPSGVAAIPIVTATAIAVLAFVTML